MNDPFAAPAGPSLLAGLIGRGIQASLTPALHEREAAAHHLALSYRRIDLDAMGLGVEALPALLDRAEAAGFAGLNITFPCKQAVIPLLHDLSEEARALGAVNTVVLRDGRRIGHNTDCSGFAEGFSRGLPGAPLGEVVQLGAGGAGSAVAEALLRKGVGRLTIHDVNAARAEDLAAALRARFGEGRARAGAPLEEAVAAADGVVNCTPVGMAKLPGTPLPVALLRPALWVAEIIYFPLETALLRAARALGCRTLDGGGMAVFQAVGAFRLFTGREPDPARMLANFAELVTHIDPKAN
ncbi:shikimate dehydrogenase [Plastoroseomonas arctica]|uniref:Shikimate dehydrogenase (NADP(+)) n=1 Tax=Plastoroseomonas arctica TaxID=1509237 RepID=A0AAF1JWS8_9PROT|nr:shikimate dehydrogenase [Plastoroseomonas arctica]MBR0654203.1 shikimate dehydrogenase [Plastoroseomonas arctica]